MCDVLQAQVKFLLLLLMLYSPIATTSEVNAQWWWAVGYCTKTDKAELGGCGKLELKKIDWGK